MVITVLTVRSREWILAVFQAKPTARTLDLCSPDGTLAMAIQITSAEISFLFVYSFNWPDYLEEEITYSQDIWVSWEYKIN